MTATTPALYTVSNLQYAPEFVAAALERQQAIKVRLIALFKWINEQCQRILKRVVKAVVNTVTTVAYNSALADFDSDWPAMPFTPSAPIGQHATPAAAVGAQPAMSALANKSQARQAGFTKATEQINSDKQPRKASFKTPKHEGRAKITDHYGDKLRKVAAEAGI